MHCESHHESMCQAHVDVRTLYIKKKTNLCTYHEFKILSDETNFYFIDLSLNDGHIYVKLIIHKTIEYKIIEDLFLNNVWYISDII